MWLIDAWFIEQLFCCRVVNKFSVLLLYKINVLGIFDTDDFFQIFVISRSAEILIKSNFPLGMYMPCILSQLKCIVMNDYNAAPLLNLGKALCNSATETV